MRACKCVHAIKLHKAQIANQPRHLGAFPTAAGCGTQPMSRKENMPCAAVVDDGCHL